MTDNISLKRNDGKVYNSKDQHIVSLLFLQIQIV